MKTTLLTGALVALSIGAFAQFTADRLVVSEYSSLVADAGKATAVTLREFNITGGASTYSVALPTAIAGVNYPFAGKVGGSTEGLITLSANNNYLSLFGYNLIPGATPASSSPYEERVVARIAADGTVNTSTLTRGSTSSSIGLPRIAITDDGTGFWVGSSGNGGIRYVALGETNTASYPTAVTASSDLSAIRSLNIFNGQLYETTTGSKLHFASVSQGTNNLPKDLGTAPATTLTTLPGFDTTTPGTPNQAAILKSTVGVGAPDLIYTVDNTNGVIEKWVLVSGTFTAKGTVTATGVTAITARVIGTTAYVYAVTGDKLIKIEDLNPLSSTVSDVDNAPVTLATAPANFEYKGIAFTPGTSPITVLPIKLSSFIGKSTLNGAQLSWATASEKNNNHFDILRSEDGKSFNKIGEVAGNGDSDATLTYSYLDKNAAKGANYYKLNQVDNNGKSEEFGPVVVTLNGKTATISVYANKASGQIKVNIYANQSSNATLNIYDANGRVVASQNVNLQTGNNQVSLNSQSASAGLHIASLNVDGVTLTKKFVFQ